MWLLNSGPLGNLGVWNCCHNHRVIPYQGNIKELYWEWDCGLRDPQCPLARSLLWMLLRSSPREMLFPDQHAVSAKITWTFSEAEHNWVIKDLAVLVDAEIHGVFYILVVPCVFIMAWQPQTSGLLYQDCLERCCLNLRMDDSAFHSSSFSFCKLRSQYKQTLVVFRT